MDKFKEKYWVVFVYKVNHYPKANFLEPITWNPKNLKTTLMAIG